MDLVKNKITQIDPRIPPNESDFLIQLIGFGAIPDRGFRCYKCNSKLVIWLRQRDSKSKPHIIWRCSSSKCQCWISFLGNSFFGNFNRTPLNNLIKIIKYWCIQLSVRKTAEILKLDSNIDVSRKTVGLVFQRLRDL
jgi:hypothetical protein